MGGLNPTLSDLALNPLVMNAPLQHSYKQLFPPVPVPIILKQKFLAFFFPYILKKELIVFN